MAKLRIGRSGQFASKPIATTKKSFQCSRNCASSKVIATVYLNGKEVEDVAKAEAEGYQYAEVLEATCPFFQECINYLHKCECIKIGKELFPARFHHQDIILSEDEVREIYLSRQSEKRDNLEEKMEGLRPAERHRCLNAGSLRPIKPNSFRFKIDGTWQNVLSI